MRTPMPITVFLLYIVVLPVAVQAEQARTVPEVGVLLPIQRADFDEAKDPNCKAAGLVDSDFHFDRRRRGDRVRPRKTAEGLQTS